MKLTNYLIVIMLLVLSVFTTSYAQTNDPYTQSTSSGNYYVDSCKDTGVANGNYPECCLTPVRNQIEQECKDYEQSGQYCIDYPNDAICKTVPLRGGTQSTVVQNNNGISGTNSTSSGSSTLASCDSIKFKSFLDILIWLKCIIAVALIPLIFALAFLFFLWGVFKFITASDPKAKQESQKVIWWGIIGLFVMVSVWGIIKILGNTFGIDSSVPLLQTQYLDPKKASK